MADLFNLLQHHAKDKADLAREIGLVFTTKFSPMGWRSYQVRTGANSWMIYHPDTGKEFHFRDGGKGTVIVKDSYMRGNIVATLKTRPSVWRWARKAA